MIRKVCWRGPSGSHKGLSTVVSGQWLLKLVLVLYRLNSQYVTGSNQSECEKDSHAHVCIYIFISKFTNWNPTKDRLYFMACKHQGRYFRRTADSCNFVNVHKLLGKQIFLCLHSCIHNRGPECLLHDAHASFYGI